MNTPKSQKQLWLEEIPQIVFATALIGTIGGFCMSMGAWFFVFLLVGIGGLM